MRSIEIPASVRVWAEEVADRAEVELMSEDHGWWVRAKPKAAEAVGFTLGISNDSEYDLFLTNGFRHEGWPWPRGADPGELCRAIAAGRVRSEIDQWRGRELSRMVVIEGPTDNWTDLNIGLLDLVVPKSWRTRRTVRASAY